jgi:putative FmdB family regulatory protein
MPLYEYECDACGHRFEIIQKFSDPPIEKCPKCGGAVHKLISSPAFQFKGTGWYVTDYARKDQKDHSGGSGSAKSDAKGSEKTETTDGTKNTAGESSATPADSAKDKPASAPAPAKKD